MQDNKQKLMRDIYKGLNTNALGIYDDCCQKFNWDRTKRGFFGPQQLLYAESATSEGYSPWFLTHNNWTKTIGGNYHNKIYSDHIEEMWFEADYGLYHDDTTRVTFARRKLNSSFTYVFIGVFKPVSVKEEILTTDIIDNKGKVRKKAGEKVWIKVYELIFDTYPQ